MSRTLQSILPIVASVKCSACGKVHDADSKSFVTLYGDIRHGASEVIGKTNFDEKGKLVGCTVLCRGTCTGVIRKALETSDNLRASVDLSPEVMIRGEGESENMDKGKPRKVTPDLSGR